MAANNPPTNTPVADALGTSIVKQVAPPLIWMGIGFLAATWFYKPKRSA